MCELTDVVDSLHPKSFLSCLGVIDVNTLDSLCGRGVITVAVITLSCLVQIREKVSLKYEG